MRISAGAISAANFARPQFALNVFALLFVTAHMKSNVKFMAVSAFALLVFLAKAYEVIQRGAHIPIANKRICSALKFVLFAT